MMSMAASTSTLRPSSPTRRTRDHDTRLPFLPINTVDSLLTDGYEDLVSPDNYKRAVQTRPPPVFAITLLPSSSPSSSIVRMRISSPSQSSFIIHRTWNDCLYLQSTLSSLYTFLARLKKGRLRKGRGGSLLYHHHPGTGAASFDSLPPGPDPESISLDLWEAYTGLPKLSMGERPQTYKSSLFKRKERKEEERVYKEKLVEEWKVFVSVLFRDDEGEDGEEGAGVGVPTLVKEMREQRKVTDFFGMWMRDVKKSVDMQEEEDIGEGETLARAVTREARMRSRRDSTKSSMIPVRQRSNTLTSSFAPPIPDLSSSPRSFSSISTLSSFSSATTTATTTTTTTEPSPSSSRPTSLSTTITIKATLDSTSTTILLRLPSSTPLPQILDALHSKFVSFLRPSSSELGPLRIGGVKDEDDWKYVVLAAGSSKLALNVYPLL